ncbi:fatty acid desaturase family protein [Okibacterium endophyticum]
MTPVIRTAGRRLEGERIAAERGPKGDPQASGFAVLSRQIKAEGLLERKVGFYLRKFLFWVAAFGATLTASVMIGDSWWQLVPAAVFGIIFTQFAFMAHEGAHRQIFASGKKNDWASLFIGNLLVGMSYSWWQNKHTRHHGNPNVIGKDPDIEKDTISFIEEDAAESTGFVKFLTKRQGYLFFPLLLLEGLNLYKHAITHLVTGKKAEHRALELVLIAVRLVGFAALAFLIMSPPIAIAFLGVYVAVFGVYMGASFAPNHKGMPILPKNARVDFLERQVLTSRNIRGGRFMDSFMGGLNYQIEHHLFPSMPRPALARTQEIVRAYCTENGVPYTETTMLQSYGIVIRYLNEVGLAARDPFDCPMVNSYRPRD